jgi:hypothetical protein
VQVDGCGPDTRTPDQRQHDALEDAANRLPMTGELPTTAGVTATVLITMTLDQLETRAGQATTHHGGTLSINEALRLAAGGKTLPVVLNHAGGILAYGRARRLASPSQRLALIARDRGCTFPHCQVSAARSEVHQHHRLGQRRHHRHRHTRTRTRTRLPQQRSTPPRLARRDCKKFGVTPEAVGGAL